MKEQAVPALQAGFVVGRRYAVMRCIKAGGMGAVYEVTDTRTQRRLALKTLRPGLVSNDTLLARFAHEAGVTARINCEHVLKIEDVGVDEASDLAYMTMDLLVGRDLETVLEQEGPFEPHRVVELLRQAALAVDAIHAAGIVHRDLTPANLFVTRAESGSESLKVLDFGVAKDMETAEVTTMPVGTPLYMPVEQVRGQHPDTRMDTYALGQVAFTLLTGHAYWSRALAAETGTERAQRFGVKLPESFDVWFAKATSEDISSRFDTAGELVAELARALQVAHGHGLEGNALQGVSVTAPGSRARNALAAIGLAVAITLAASFARRADAPALEPARTHTPLPDVSAEQAQLAPAREVAQQLEPLPVQVPLPIEVAPSHRASGELEQRAIRAQPKALPHSVQPVATPPVLTEDEFLGRH